MVPEKLKFLFVYVVVKIMKVPLFAILLQLISYYIDELLVRTMMLINHWMGRRILGINRMKIIYFIIGLV